MRAAIFIDGGYFINQLRQNNIAPDYEKLAEYFLAPLREKSPSLDLLRCYFYYCAPWMSQEPTENEMRRKEAHDLFTKEIENLNRWAIRLGKLQKRREGQKKFFEQKRVDVLLSCDMVRHSAAGHIQHAILIAGDSDFIPAVEATKESGVTLTLWHGDDNTVHQDLIDLADEVRSIDWSKIPKSNRKKDKAFFSILYPPKKEQPKWDRKPNNRNRKPMHSNNNNSQKKKKNTYNKGRGKNNKPNPSLTKKITTGLFGRFTGKSKNKR